MTTGIKVHEGTIWTLVSLSIKLSLKFASNLALTRLLAPEAFGIAAIANSILTGINMFSDFGIKQSVVRSSRTDDAYFQTAWTVQLLRALVLAAIIMVLARPFSAFYAADGLVVFLLIIATSNLAMGFNSIEVLRDIRHANLRRVSLIDNAAALIGVVAMVLWALVSPTYVALAVGALVSTAAFAVCSLFAYPRRNCRIRFEKDALSDLVLFGKWVLISTVFAFATTQMDRLALGKLVSMELIGFYSIAWMWASISNLVLDQWAANVFFPLASRGMGNMEKEESVWKVRRIFVLLVAIGATFTYIISDLLVSVLYTSRYSPVAQLIRQLTPVLILYSIEQTYSHMLIAQGRPKSKVIGQALSVVFFAAMLLPVFDWEGVSGVIGLLGLSAVIRILWQVYRLGARAWRDVALDLTSIAGYAVFTTFLYALIGASDNRWYQFSVTFTIGVLIALLAFAAYRRIRRICEP